MKLFSIKNKLVVLYALLFFISYDVSAKKQIIVSKNATSDTTFFANQTGGWELFAPAYLIAVDDSVQFEIILKYTNESSINVGESNLIGTLSQTFIPAINTKIQFAAPYRTWEISIDPDGKCYLKLLDGLPPTGNPAIIAFQVHYLK